jgi:MinD superfamily P-loop ATPase
MATKKIKIAVLSGKGGTGKTFLSVNLASVTQNSVYIDCDVEEPNGHLFFKPQNLQTENVTVKVPFVDPARCTGCRKCVEFCKFNALAYIQGKWMLFDEICHSCGGCVLFCPEKALTEKNRIIGSVQKGVSEDITVMSGILKIGESSGIPIINKLLHMAQDMDENIFIDCPPGSACIVMESIKDADYCLLVAEPTLFGMHNLKLVYELISLFKKPHGVVLNKCIEAVNPSEEFCKAKKIRILAKIPFDKKLGELNSNALIVSRENMEYAQLFSALWQKIAEEVHNEAAFDSKR